MTVQETPRPEVRPAEARRPGRPPQTDAEAERARRNILDATEHVFAEHNYHGINVAKIIDAAGIARPTFYRYFRNTDEALGVVLRDLGRSLGWAIVNAVREAQGAIPKVLAGIDAYLNWARDHRHLLQSLYAGMHDPSTLIHQMRPLVLDRMVQVIGAQFELVDRPRPDAPTLDILLNSIEFACFRLYRDGADREGAEQATRVTMIRMALALVGSADDWRLVLEHPEMQRFMLGDRA